MKKQKLVSWMLFLGCVFAACFWSPIVLPAGQTKSPAVSAQMTPISTPSQREQDLLRAGLELQWTDKKLDEAIAVYRQLVEENPAYLEAWDYLGDALFHQNKLDEALVAYQKVLALQPNHPWAWHSLGKVLSKQGKLDEALAAYRKQVEITPNAGWAWTSLGDFLRAQGKFDEALTAYRKQVEVKPEHTQGWDNLEAILRQQGKLDEALAAYRTQLERTPDQPWAWENLGNFLRKQGNFAEALAAYRKQVELNPESKALENMIEMSGAVRDWDGAAATLNDLLQSRSEDADVFTDILFFDALAALGQHDPSRYHARISELRQIVPEDDVAEEFVVILSFFDWLADAPAVSWTTVIAAIENSPSDMHGIFQIDEELSLLLNAIVLQYDPEIQPLAQDFIAFFDGQIDLETLKAKLAEDEKK